MVIKLYYGLLDKQMMGSKKLDRLSLTNRDVFVQNVMAWLPP